MQGAGGGNGVSLGKSRVMATQDSFGSYFKEGKDLLQDYVETRLELYRLQGIRAVSKTAGYLIWLILAIFMIWMIGLFAALVFAFWMSELTGSMVYGFGITLGIIIIKVLLIRALRRQLFVDPIIRKIIRKLQEAEEKTVE